ncbi:hypothetical protein ACP4OV_022376 [Aristida adscensionis]
MLVVLVSSLAIVIIASFPSPAMATPKPLFTATFDESHSDNYGAFIDGLRKKLGKPGHFSHNRPVPPPVEDGPPRPTSSSRRRPASSRCEWWELTPGMIAGATYAGFGGSYHNLLGDTGKLAEVTVGPEQMAGAVHVLAARTRADLADGAAQDRARHAVAVLLLMVHEATRLTTVSELVAGLMHQRSAMKSGTITAEMKAQVNGWRDLSAALLTADAAPMERFTPFKDMGLDTLEKAAKTLGILLFVKVK